MRRIRRRILALVDIVSSPFVYPAAFFLKKIRAAGIERLPLCRKALFQIGVFPVRDHYHEPLVNAKHLRHPLSADRILPGIEWDAEDQLRLLNSFQFSDELNDVQISKVDDLTFYLNNGAFEAGDAEYWYNLIRLKKPSRIFEVGSGYSTLMAIRAIRRNEEEISGYKCKHVSIEPFEVPWLERTSASVIRKKVEDVDRSLFSELGESDILFIDSSHVIRPQGDVVFEYLELLPGLNKGVIVHIHDIFSPKDYPDEWVRKAVRFWNEQYLLEAFLTSNRCWKIIGALNFLHHNYYSKLKEKSPFLTPEREPGSFYIQKVA